MTRPPEALAPPPTRWTDALGRLRAPRAGRAPSGGRAGSWRLWVVLAVGLSIASATVGYEWAERAGSAQLLATSTERLELYAGMLESEIGRYAQLPRLVAMDAEVTAVLDAPQDLARRDRASLRLARIAARSGVRALWVVDAQGVRLAGSEAPGTPAAEAAALPPDRLARELGAGSPGFFAADARGAGTDYFVVHAVQRDNRTQGWLVARIDLAPLEATWVDLATRTQSERVLVLDEHQRVLLSSVPEWKLSQLVESSDAAAPAAPGVGDAVPRLVLSSRQRLSAGAQIADLVAESPGAAGSNAPRSPWPCLAQDSPIASLGVRLVALSDTADVWRQARWSGVGGGAAGAFVGLLWIYLRLRQRSLAAMAGARDALRRAHDELEVQVHERTRQLQEANIELQLQVAERLRMQDELIQAGKLAVLGQMSAEISHEINQPLTALRALSRNTEQLLERGRFDAVTANLRSIGGLLERMERMARQLKSFARKGPSGPRAVRVVDAIDNARVLLEPRLRTERVDLHVDVDASVRVLCDGPRLEQVLVNLLGNAIDAMNQQQTRRVRIAARAEGDRCVIRVSDTGGGIDDTTLHRLFEPFFTTKPAGEGLGLGLVISQNIVQQHGGVLRALHDPEGVAFEFDLALAKEP
jgi:two-component system C4-dicarboxylate transport sensor histidine kinase DctB